ncbi:hypothetical protein WN51_06599 [Melipona quadrifasciata]|uniref:Uncharacterized protein n=1 Tax=Melipona quadrifasciata TaxID=166423 RepID=A0A0N0BCV4_9HYME|nr:hypothetical protein WN51_06599 [Melipona quadrifasciata]
MDKEGRKQTDIEVQCSERLRAKRDGVNQALSFTQTPDNYYEATELRRKNQWRRTMQEELENIRRCNAWEVVPRKEETKTVKTKGVYTVKQDRENREPKYKLQSETWVTKNHMHL